MIVWYVLFPARAVGPCRLNRLSLALFLKRTRSIVGTLLQSVPSFVRTCLYCVCATLGVACHRTEPRCAYWS